MQFKRGDYVHFKGNEKYKPCNTYVWASFGHQGSSFYLIEHEDGFERDKWLSKKPFADGFESIHSSELQEGIKYIQVDCLQDSYFETHELELLERVEK